ANGSPADTAHECLDPTRGLRWEAGRSWEPHLSWVPSLHGEGWRAECAPSTAFGLAAAAENRHDLLNHRQGVREMRRRSFLRASAAGAVAASLPRISIAQPANARVLKFVPQANLTLLD